MSLILSHDADFVPLPPGLHPARIYLLAAVGPQETHYGVKNKLIVGFECPTLEAPDGRPMTITKWYTASLDERSNLYQDLKSWRGRPLPPDELHAFNLRRLVGPPCQIQVSKDANGRSVVDRILPKAIDEMPPPVHDPIIFDYERPDPAMLQALPEWVQKYITPSVAQTGAAPGQVTIVDEDVPW